jgi:hypothetical protein
MCPLEFEAGSTAQENVSYVAAHPADTDISFALVNITIQSPFPFYGPGQPGAAAALIYDFNQSFEAGETGGRIYELLNIVIPFNYSNLPATGTFEVGVTASAILS